jgi:hypothetical protein
LINCITFGTKKFMFTFDLKIKLTEINDLKISKTSPLKFVENGTRLWYNNKINNLMIEIYITPKLYNLYFGGKSAAYLYS